MSAEENKALVRRFFEETWVKRNPAAVGMFVAAGYVEHAGFPGSLSSGRDGLKQLISLYRGAFPDLRSTIEDMFAEGDRVAYRWSARGTHLGEWAGISPTGNHMTASGITIFRVSEGKIAEGWVSLDLRRSDEELRWLTESEQVHEASPEYGDVPFDPYSSAYDALVRNLTWRIRAERARERERIEQELRVARQIQQALLPKGTPKLDGWHLAAYYRPARQIGGDFYDFVELPNGLLGLVVGDATGHGMPAALLMATTRGMLRAVAQS
nr:ester cyclase [Actinomycetota bacterium]